MDKQILLHEKVLELRSNGLSYGRIIVEIQDLYSVRLTKSIVSYWVNKQHSPLGRAHAFTPVPTPELAYVIGVKFGDGSLNERLRIYGYRIRLQAKDREFVEEFDRCPSVILRSPRHRLWRGAGRPEFHVEAGSYLLYRFLRKPLEELKPFIERDLGCMAALLRGFFDSEGCVSKEGKLTASNTNLATLGYVRILMAHYFGIETTGPHLQSRKGSEISRRGRIYTRNSNCYDIYVRMKSLRKFQAVVNFVIVRKKLRLGRFLARGFIT